eukprot:tig00021572_g22393.t1
MPSPTPERTEVATFTVTMQANSQAECKAFIGNLTDAAVQSAFSDADNSYRAYIKGSRCGAGSGRALLQVVPIQLDIGIVKLNTATGTIITPAAFVQALQAKISSNALVINGKPITSMSNVIVDTSQGTVLPVGTIATPAQSSGGAPSSVPVIVGVCVGIGGGAIVLGAIAVMVYRMQSRRAVGRPSGRLHRSEWDLCNEMGGIGAPRSVKVVPTDAERAAGGRGRPAFTPSALPPENAAATRTAGDAGLVPSPGENLVLRQTDGNINVVVVPA